MWIPICSKTKASSKIACKFGLYNTRRGHFRNFYPTSSACYLFLTGSQEICYDIDGILAAQYLDIHKTF